MMRCAPLRLLLCLVVPAGCVVGTIEGGPPRRDTGVKEGGYDVEPPDDEDVGDEDTGSPEADTGTGPLDTGVRDTGTPDTGTSYDTGTTDTGTPDTAPPDAGPPPTYPAGPYGRAVGQTYPNLCFKGYRDGVAGKAAGKWETICLGDYYDPSATKNVRAIRLIAGALW